MKEEDIVVKKVVAWTLKEFPRGIPNPFPIPA